MAVFSADDFAGHEQVAFCNDPASGLRAIIAIHDTTLGPALGGCRMWPYETEQDALEDVLRLSRGMTYKSALAGLELGGGKSVVIGDPRADKSGALFEALGRFVDRMGGHYIVAEDVGTTVADLERVRRSTRHVAGIAEGGSGDPSPATAWGVFHGIRAALRWRLRKEELAGVRVAVQGLGQVGYALCRLLHDAGAALVVSDIDADAVRRAAREFHAETIMPDAIFGVEADVFAPCALGAILNDDTIEELGAPIVAGSANNQLAEERHGAILAARGVTYCPDYVINAGGIINISHEGRHYDRNAAFAHVAKIHDAMLDLFARAEQDELPTNVTANRLAEERIAEARRNAAVEPIALAS